MRAITRAIAAGAVVLATQSADAVIMNYNAVGTHNFVVPEGVSSIAVQAWGAQGNRNQHGGANGGRGGYAAGDLATSSGQALQINVGGGGNAMGSTATFNGGGAAGSSPCNNCRGGAGGGASDVRIGGTGLANRAIVAGGGGGAAGARFQGLGRGTGGGGGGGYYGGGGGAAWPHQSNFVATGGNQGSGGAGGQSSYNGISGNDGQNGSLGVGGNGGAEVSSSQGGTNTNAAHGGAGGGLTGGSGAYGSNWTGQSGAGGSSYLGGVTNGTTIGGVRTGVGAVVLNFNLPELIATPASGGMIDFGTINANSMLTLSDVISLGNNGGSGTFVSLLGATLGGPFSLAGGDDTAMLNGVDNMLVEELFSLKFDATGLSAGMYSELLTFDTNLGQVRYTIKGTVQTVVGVAEPASMALFGLGLLGMIARRRGV